MIITDAKVGAAGPAQRAAPSARPRASDVRPSWRWFAAAAASLAATVALFVTLPGTSGILAGRAVTALMLLAVAVACVRTGHGLPGRHRRWRLALATPALVMAVTGIYTVAVPPPVTVFTGPVPFSYGQIAYVIPTALALLVLFLYPAHPQGPHHVRTTLGGNWWLTTLLDGLLVVGSIGALAWVFVLRDVIDAAAGDVEHLVATLTICAANLVVVCAVLVLWIFRRPTPPVGFALLGTGLTLISVQFLGVTAAVTRGHASPPSTELLWTVGAWCLLLACLTPVRPRPGRPADPSETIGAGRRDLTLRWAYALLPLLPLIVAGLVGVLDVLDGAGPDVVDVIGLFGLFVLGLGRQMLIIADNIGLLRRLHGSERQLRHQAFHDPLTGLANRTLFGERLTVALSDQLRDGDPLAVLYVDLDDFKGVNDTLGHEAGDRLLQVTARRLTHAVRSGDTVARLGGDEFAILLAPGGDNPATVGSRILTALRAPVLLSGSRQRVGASVGLVVAQAVEELSAELLLHRADAAMYAAKAAGTGSLTIYDPSIERATPAAGSPAATASSPRLALTRALRGEPGDGELVVRYQPIVDLPGGHPVASQAELWWCQPAHGDMPAVALVQASERGGLLPALTLATLRRVCADLPRLRGGDTPPPVYLPVPATVPLPATFVTAIAGARADGSLRTGDLVVELIGAEPGTDPVDLRWPGRLHDHGVGLCLSGFGFADAYLDLLRVLPVETVILTAEMTATWIAPHLTARDVTVRAGLLGMLRALRVDIIAADLPGPDDVRRAVALGITRARGHSTPHLGTPHADAPRSGARAPGGRGPPGGPAAGPLTGGRRR
ncbi:putative Diguanylate cyclase/phosphodiesterase [Frankia canadensis]|uniref:Putative Diguanylate cyclase/phosphodiesterase n=1 Tax=Frankia canadensis TaxID=1836972 RepID=A0A2I2KRY9_9ACTN|nr:diguanylate cyclase [Frankia canadensis]SNQ48422.1 putative Diguanylate cyclase/phosphodiesterase [Frankia canadensis]SOU55712.1 putative Diguanylate cyclase/phosphodiesterase [Frankia canadensis]